MALRFWPKWFDKPYGSIKPKDYLDKWLVIKNANYSTERANKYIILLRAVSKFGSNFYEYKDEARSIRPFKKKHGEGRKAVALSIEQLHLLIDHTPDPVYKILFWFLYFTGLRIGEARALQKEDVQGSIIDVNKSIRSFKEGFKPPKNQSSYRMNRIDSTTYEVIQPLLQGDPGFLFGGEEPLSMRQVDKARKEALESAGLPYFVNHDLRHSFGSYLLSEGVNLKAVSVYMGHSTTETTARVYEHLLEKLEDFLVTTLEAANSPQTVHNLFNPQNTNTQNPLPKPFESTP